MDPIPKTKPQTKNSDTSLANGHFIAGESISKPQDLCPTPGTKPAPPASPQVTGAVPSLFSTCLGEKLVYLPSTKSKVPPLLLVLPPAIEAAEGYIELVTQPATKLGVSRSMRRKFARTALGLASNCGECWHNNRHEARRQMVIGKSLRLLKRYSAAMQAFRKAAKHRPNRIDALLALAGCQKRTGLMTEAIGSLTRALSITPEDSRLHYHLACYLCASGQSRAAIYELAWALELRPSLRKRAILDADFEPLRNAPAFLALTAARSSAK